MSPSRRQEEIEPNQMTDIQGSVDQRKMAVYQKTVEYMEELGQLGYVAYDYETDQIQFSEGAKQIFGIEFSEHTNWRKGLPESLDMDTRRMIHRLVAQARRNGSFEKTDIEKRCEDGTLKMLRVLFGMVEESLIVCIVQDMSEWNRRELEIRNQLQLTQDIIDAIPLPMFMKDLQGTYEICNDALLKLLKYDRDCFMGLAECDEENPLNAENYTLYEQPLIKSGGVITYEMFVKRADSEERQCVMTKSLVSNSENHPVGIVGTLRDVTEDKRDIEHIEKLLGLKDAMMEITHAIMDNRSEAELFDLILDKGLDTIESADHGTILMKDDDGLFRPVAWRGYTHDAMADFELSLKQSFVWRATQGSMNHSVRINDLSAYLVEDVPDLATSELENRINASLCSPIVVEGEIIGLMNLDSTRDNAFDESDLTLSEYMREQLEIALTKRKLYDRVIYLSRHDELTGVYNRRYFEEIAEQMLKRAKRYKESFCIVVFDLDGLKKINDTYGHQCGDEVIKRFAATMSRTVRETDLLARYGGDEFIGLFDNSDADRLRERLLGIAKQLRESPVSFGDHQIVSSFSFGIAVYPSHGDSYNKLVSVADKRMYAFKNTAMQNSLSTKASF